MSCVPRGLVVTRRGIIYGKHLKSQMRAICLKRCAVLIFDTSLEDEKKIRTIQENLCSFSGPFPTGENLLWAGRAKKPAGDDKLVSLSVSGGFSLSGQNSRLIPSAAFYKRFPQMARNSCLPARLVRRRRRH